MAKKRRAKPKARRAEAPQTLGARLRIGRQARGLSLSEAARLIKLSKAALGAWEVDRTKPTYEHLQLIAEIYQTSAQWLISGEGEPPQPAAVIADPQAELTQTLLTLQKAGFEPTEIIPTENGRYRVKFDRIKFIRTGSAE
jgi:transcriptional regulator with XRE-family HTH domain